MAEATAIYEYQAPPEQAAAARDAPTLAPAHCQNRPAAETIGRSADAALISKFAEGRAFGEYELVEEIARGGMGVVFKARQRRLNRTVAVKMILAGELADREDVRRFLSEAESAAGLDHPGIVPVYESGEIGGQHFFSMGFVDGESLATRLADGPLPPRRAADLLAQVADAVDYAHERGVIHRDLKPGNKREESPDVSLLLAVESGRATRPDEDGLQPNSHQALLDALAAIGGRSLVGHRAEISGVAISPDGRWIITVSSDHTARLWPLAADDATAHQRTLRGHKGAITSLAISSDSRWLVTGGNDHTAQVWDLAANDPAGRCIFSGHPVASVAISADGRWVVTGSNDNTARVWDLTAENPSDHPRVLAGHGHRVQCVAISPDGRWIVTGSEDSTARVWDLTANDPSANPRVLVGHQGAVTCLAIGPDSRSLVTGSADKIARVWDLAAESPAANPRLIGAQGEHVISRVAISPDSRWLVTGGDAMARVWDLTAEQPAANPRVLRGPAVNNVAVSLGGRAVVTGSLDRTARLWDLTANDPSANARILAVHPMQIGSVAISPDGRWIATGSSQRSLGQPGEHDVRLWDLAAGNGNAEPRLLTGHRGAIRGAAMSGDSRWLVTGSDDQTVRIWDLTAKDPGANPRVLKINGFAYVTSVAISHDGRRVVASWAFFAQVWDLKAKDPAADTILLSGHRGAVHGVAISADGRWVVTGGFDMTTRIWDLTEANPSDHPLVLRGHGGSVYGVAISPDGRWLATASEDHRVRLWRWQWDDLVSLAAQTGRNFSREEWALYLPNVPCRKTFPELPASYGDEVADLVQIGAKEHADLTRVASLKVGEPNNVGNSPLVATEGRIRNPGFESTLDDWSINIYGAKSEVVLDREVKHGGNSSLRIASTALSDTAVGQELQLNPGQNYRLTGWVKTSSLDPKGSPVFGTFQVQNAGGRGTIATGANHQGDNDWTQVSLFFQSPPTGKVRIAAFFVGFGQGTGTAWFDDLKLGAIDLAKVPLKITRNFLLPDTISPYQYGQFIEYLCDLVPSMWAEKLNDGSFEGPSNYKVAFIKEEDNREKPWYPSGDTNRAEYAHDPQNPVSGQVSRKIVVRQGPPSSVGLSQDGVAVKAGQAYSFSCFLRQNGMEGPVAVRLHRDGRTLAGGELRASDQWQKATVELRPTETTSAATLSIELRGPGTLWIDNASLMPDDSIAGWRADVVEAVRALKPGVIRFGGSALDDSNLGEFEWRDTIGPVERRRPFRAWGGWQPAGAGLEEIVQFCRLVDAEPLICLRVSKKGPQDAADQVQYFNGAADTPQGRLRAENGHMEPYGIKFWQVGNERAGGEYEAQLPEFCRAMKAVDPTIAILSSYPTAGVLAGSGQWLDYVAPHHYSIANLSGAEADLQTVRQLIDKHAAGRKIKVAVTEWNTTAGDWGPRRAMLWTLDNALACARYHNLLHRHCDLVEIANRSNLINSFCSGILQTDNHRLYKTPTYYAQQLYATRTGNRPLAIESSGPINLWPDVSATLSADGKKLVLFAVNQSPRDVTRPLDLRAFGDAPRTVSVWTLADTREAGGPDATNSFAEPDRISPAESRFPTGGGMFDYRFPKWSLSVLEWPVGD